MVPLALGTQTGGSIVRPASYCGVVGFKPTYGTVSTEGVKRYANTLDTLGWYARSVDDIALLARVFEVVDNRVLATPSPQTLRIGVCRTPYWDAGLPATHAALTEATRQLIDAGAAVTDLTLGPDFSALDDLRRTIMWAEGRVSFLNLRQAVPDRISPSMRKSMEGIGNDRLCAALDEAAVLRPAFDALMRPLDAVIAPSAQGEAPLGLASTGGAMFNGLWTLLHVPCISLPGLTGAHGLPVGIQLVGPRYSDAKLLAAAQTVAGLLRA
jgi:Asp-tRNA(Asn)/Glu-tRNA(Gln) amidotransferase A subunit family amidase